MTHTEHHQRQDLILWYVRQQSDKASPKNGNSNGTVPFGTGSCATTWENPAVPVDQRFERSQILVVDINRSRRFFRTVRAEATAQLLFQSGLLLASFANFSGADSTHSAYLECVLI